MALTTIADGEAPGQLQMKQNLNINRDCDFWPNLFIIVTTSQETFPTF